MWDGHAHAWSLLGALVSSNGKDRAAVLSLPIESIRVAAIALSRAIGDTDIVVWNDAPDRTRREVLAAIERARFTLAADEAAEATTRI